MRNSAFMVGFLLCIYVAMERAEGEGEWGSWVGRRQACTPCFRFRRNRALKSVRGHCCYHSLSRDTENKYVIESAGKQGGIFCLQDTICLLRRKLNHCLNDDKMLGAKFYWGEHGTITPRMAIRMISLPVTFYEVLFFNK